MFRSVIESCVGLKRRYRLGPGSQSILGRPDCCGPSRLAVLRESESCKIRTRQYANVPGGDVLRTAAIALLALVLAAPAFSVVNTTFDEPTLNPAVALDVPSPSDAN